MNFSDGVSCIIPHLARFGTKIHTEFIHPRKESKTETLFCSKYLFVCNNSETLDDSNLSDVIAPEQNYIPIIDHFKYLGSFDSRWKCIDSRILKAEIGLGLIRKMLFTSWILLKGLFMSHSHHLFYDTAPNAGVWLTDFSKNVMFVIDLFEPWLVTIEYKLVYFE